MMASSAAVGLEREQDRRLEPVGILIFVDHDVIEATAYVLRAEAVTEGFLPIGVLAGRGPSAATAPGRTQPRSGSGIQTAGEFLMLGFR